MSSSPERLWRAAWPKVGAVAIGLGLWQLVVWSGWKPPYILPGPGPVFSELGSRLADGTILEGTAITLRRGAIGFSAAVAIGMTVGLAVSRSRVVRSAVGSFITGLQTMPSIAWFPLALVLFGRTEGAILFVVILGAAPSVANGLVHGVDTIPPLMLRAGRVLGARGTALYRHVILPAALPSFVSGLKQGWAFAWRSLMAGELLVIIEKKSSLGVQLSYARELAKYETLMAVMIVILVIGIVVDALVFGWAERAIRRRWGLLES